MFIVILSNFGNTSRFFSAQNVLQYILDGTMQKAQTLECPKKIQQDNYVQLYKRISRKLGTGSKYKNMEVAESAVGLLIYKEIFIWNKNKLQTEKICVHVRKPVDHLVTTSARRTCRTQAKVIKRLNPYC
jgi:hypothetical protein